MANDNAWVALKAKMETALAGVSGLRQIVLFGSMAEGRARPDSDIDVAIEAEAPLDAAQKLALMDALAMTFGRPVDVIDLRTVGQPLLGQILAKGIRLRGRDEEWARLIYRNMLDNEDFVPLQRHIHRQRQQAWIKR